MFSAWVKLRVSVLWVDVHASETLATLEGMLNVIDDSSAANATVNA